MVASLSPFLAISLVDPALNLDAQSVTPASDLAVARELRQPPPQRRPPPASQPQACALTHHGGSGQVALEVGPARPSRRRTRLNGSDVCRRAAGGRPTVGRPRPIRRDSHTLSQTARHSPSSPLNSGSVPEGVLDVSRFQLLPDTQWSLVEELLPLAKGRQGRPVDDRGQQVPIALRICPCG